VQSIVIYHNDKLYFKHVEKNMGKSLYADDGAVVTMKFYGPVLEQVKAVRLLQLYLKRL